MKCSPAICKYLGITLLPQAGVALGMCVTAKELGPEGGLKMCIRDSVKSTEGAPAFDEIQRRLAAKGEEMQLAIRIQREDIFSAMHTI